MNMYFRSFELLSRLLGTETRWRSGLTFGQDVGYVMNWFSPVYFPLGPLRVQDGSTGWYWVRKWQRFPIISNAWPLPTPAPMEFYACRDFVEYLWGHALLD